VSSAASITESAHNFHMPGVTETSGSSIHCKCLYNQKSMKPEHESVGIQFIIFFRRHKCKLF